MNIYTKKLNSSYLAYFLIFFLLISGNALLHAQDVDGRAVFRTNCASCHSMERQLTGPALNGTLARIQSAKGLSEEQAHDWLFRWIRNAPAIIAAGDPYAAAMLQQFGTVMPSFVNLSNEEIEAVIHYINYWDDTAQYPGAERPGQVPGDETAATGISSNLILIILVIVLVLIALILTRVTNILGRIAREKSGEEVPAEVPFYLNRNFHIAIVIVVVVVGSLFLVEGAISIGRQQGYAPEQPINFSHKLHAGINGIDCKYCHVGVEEGKVAGIPSVNICMNCHKFVNVGPDEDFKRAEGLRGPGNDTVEIYKIYAAAGFDPATQTYDRSRAQAVRWVRIHNLPDHVYFSHAQHVNVGKIACQTCHGPVEEMDVMYQFSSLSMGWCISCHRETNIQFTENGYYKNYFQDYHERLSNQMIQGVTVEMIGGTECQKCHY